MTALDTLLAEHADSLDSGAEHAAAVLPALGQAGLLRSAVPKALGGDGAPLSQAIEAIARVAQRSLAAAFVFWGQRAFIEYLVQGENPALRDQRLPALLAGEYAGATGLSNAMKYLSGIEALGLAASDGLIDGRLPWLTNLRPQGFIAAAAVAGADGTPFIVALPHDRAGLRRSADLDLIALRGTYTAALNVQALHYSAADLIASDARRWLPGVRPAFLGLQCGLAIGLARASLATARLQGVAAKAVLGDAIDATQAELDRAVAALAAGVDDGRFVRAAVPLFELRIALVHVALQAVQLELQASGGRAYHRDQPLGFARRWREAAFLPIVTPSLTQLQGELIKQRAAA